ncbi:MAG: phosphatidylserine/phosphatidylglycerophosphate/cardiolipin synthase family protein [Sandaracinaceae bacterium]
MPRVRCALSLTVLLAGCSTCDTAPAAVTDSVQGGFDRGREVLADGTERAREGQDALGRVADRVLEPGVDLPPESATPPPPARDGNRARLLINGEASYLERLRLIDQAQHSIRIQALIFKADAVGTAIADRLIARKRENPDLDIRVIVDAYANLQDYDAQMLYFELMNAGIRVVGYEPLFLEWVNEINLDDWTAGNKRYHEKYFVIDDRRAVVGGMNIGDEYARCGATPELIWRDQDIYLEGPVVEDIARAFDENFDRFVRIRGQRPAVLESDIYWDAWRNVHPNLRSAVTASIGRERPWRSSAPRALDLRGMRARQVRTTAVTDARVQFIRNRPRVHEHWIDEAYRARIDAAQRRVVIANAYFIPTPELLRALVSAARRGVEVTVLTNSKDTNDIPLINDAGRVSYRELMRAGVRVYEWHGERHGEGTLHAKLGTFDDEVAIIGSYNLDPRSYGLNSEDVVVVESPAIARVLTERVLETDLRFADRITDREAEEWSNPALVPHVTELPDIPFWDPRFDEDRFEMFLIEQASRNL